MQALVNRSTGQLAHRSTGQQTKKSAGCCFKGIPTPSEIEAAFVACMDGLAHGDADLVRGDFPCRVLERGHWGGSEGGDGDPSSESMMRSRGVEETEREARVSAGNKQQERKKDEKEVEAGELLFAEAVFGVCVF